MALFRWTLMISLFAFLFGSTAYAKNTGHQEAATYMAHQKDKQKKAPHIKEEKKAKALAALKKKKQERSIASEKVKSKKSKKKKQKKS